ADSQQQAEHEPTPPTVPPVEAPAAETHGPAAAAHKPTRGKPGHIDELLRLLVEREASDLHMRVGEPPVMRIHGRLVRTEFPRLEPEDTKRLLYGILNEERRKRYEEAHEMDLSHAIRGLARFRVNVFRQRGYVGAVLRVIP